MQSDDRVDLKLGMPKIRTEIVTLGRQIDEPNPSTHPSIDQSLVLLTYLLIESLALFLLLDLGAGSDHRMHTPTTGSYQ